MEEVEIPQYFACPISFQIMEDPVTTVTGITYDRESIEQWLLKAKECVCPVTKQPLPRSFQYLTPNHTLRRLIQAWSSSNAGVERVSTPKTPLNMMHVKKLVKGLEAPHDYCSLETSLKKLHALASQSERNRICMTEAGVAKAMVKVINKNFQNRSTTCMEEALWVLHLLWNNDLHNSMRTLVGENFDFINSLTWILQLPLDNNNNSNMVNVAMTLLKLTVEVADSTLLGSLRVEFFKDVVRVLRNRSLFQQAIKSSLLVLTQTLPVARSRTKIVEAGAVTELIELELEKPEKNVTELIFNLLAHLCSCAEGREQFLRHAAGVAVFSKRLLRVSAATDDRAIHVFSAIAKFSASDEVILEMLRVGAVSKLCMMMQADCASYLKEKAKEILRLHSKVWHNSPCIQVYLLTRHQR
ncbi:hypothetical protein Fmac_021829 [Flemingia macrophylla]|uniref:U-box domain-containing protein n=1 Tax=Flemingia macrophylla TaxID=520843 RepID=A0ABD1LXZ5_9FABA